MTKAQISAMPDVEVRLRLENVRLRIKLVELLMSQRSERAFGGFVSLGDLIARKNRLRTQEKKWRRELDRREIAKKIERTHPDDSPSVGESGKEGTPTQAQWEKYWRDRTSFDYGVPQDRRER